MHVAAADQRLQLTNIRLDCYKHWCSLCYVMGGESYALYYKSPQNDLLVTHPASHFEEAHLGWRAFSGRVTCRKSDTTELKRLLLQGQPTGPSGATCPNIVGLLQRCSGSCQSDSTLVLHGSVTGRPSWRVVQIRPDAVTVSVPSDHAKRGSLLGATLTQPTGYT